MNAELSNRLETVAARNQRKQMTQSEQAASAKTVGSNDVFGTPAAVTELDCAFGGSMEKLLPPYATIPDEYKRGRTKWNKVVSRWFFSGLPKETRFVPKAGIDANAAKAHLRAILVSFDPKHEHKEAGCAYLLSKWFEDVEVPNDESSESGGKK